MVPAIAVPRDDPRLDTERDRPEISPCSSSGSSTARRSRRRQHEPEAQADQEKPGTNASTLSGVTRPIKMTMPVTVVTKPATINVFCVPPLGEPLRAEGRQ